MKLTYTVDEVADVLGISKSSVYNLRNNGVIHAIEKLPGLLFSVQEIQNVAGIENECNAFNYRKLLKRCEELEAEYTLMKLKEMPNSSGNYHWATMQTMRKHLNHIIQRCS